MGLFGEKNPIICELNAGHSESLEKVKRIILSTISNTDGLYSDLFSAPIVQIIERFYARDIQNRFIFQWRLPKLPKQTMDALEDLVAYFHKPNLTQGRHNPLRKKRPPSKYTTIHGGKSQTKSP